MYCFGNGFADGSANDKNLLGGKGANLAEMTSLGIPVPPGFTITTEICTKFMNDGEFPSELQDQVSEGVRQIETYLNQQFDKQANPLLVSIRSGARQSMPGMMETVLNVGLTEKTIPGLIEKSGDERFVYDAYRRLIMMFADVVMEKSEGIEPEDGLGIREQLESIMHQMKQDKGISNDTDFTGNDLKILSEKFKLRIREVLGKEFPDDAHSQLWGGISAVFKSWNGKRAKSYRKIENIPDEWGTAVNVQAMVFGNMGNNSATGVAFTRNPATGERVFYGEWLLNAQGEDVVAGIRTPNPLNNSTRLSDNGALQSLEDRMPKNYRQLNDIQQNLEFHYKDMQDIEFTIQDGKLWMLQTRVGKRNGTAAIRIALDMLDEKLIDEQEALKRILPEHLDEIMHPMVDPAAEIEADTLATGLPAGPGSATGQITFTADEAEIWKSNGKNVILIRNETSPEDVQGMHAAEAILTSKGGMTSHAALVARGWGKCCIVGCSDLIIDSDNKSVNVNGAILNEGDWLTLNGTSGKVYLGRLPLKTGNLESNPYFLKLMELTDKFRKIGVRTNADRPKDAQIARDFGAKGIGLCRTEHMFFDPDRIKTMQKMIVSDNKVDRVKALEKLLPFQQQDFYSIMKTMAPYPVTIRLLDPPLHEFLPTEGNQIQELASELNISVNKLNERVEILHELNPMLGHRGCRLGIAYPEITEMQSRAIFQATVQLINEGFDPHPEVMIPLVGSVTEFNHQKAVVDQSADSVRNDTRVKFEYQVGTMIELPRACLTADTIATEADFISFGTNDLTQTTFGFSRDDIAGFLPKYLEDKILTGDPFQSIDRNGVGALVQLAVEKARTSNSGIKIGICGEHGGDPDSIQFFKEIGLDYVSCSPFRVPIARLSGSRIM